MRSDALLVALLLLSACDEKPAGPPPSRFAAVKKNPLGAASKFCDLTPEKKYVPPALRPFGAGAAKPAGWTWVNVWATWCKPCVEEMGVLNKWRDALAGDQLKVSFELLSIDEAAAQPQLEDWAKKNLPGTITWIRGEEDFPPFLESIGADRNAAIPIHLLVDPKGMLRCVRVGAIHEQNYGAVRDLIAGG